MELFLFFSCGAILRTLVRPDNATKVFHTVYIFNVRPDFKKSGVEVFYFVRVIKAFVNLTIKVESSLIL